MMVRDVGWCEFAEGFLTGGAWEASYGLRCGLGG
jgi:hypothetical protein